MQDHLGPLKIEWDLFEVGEYITESPTADENECIATFCGKIELSQVCCKNVPLGDKAILAATCGHLMKISLEKSKGVVKGFWRGTLG